MKIYISGPMSGKINLNFHAFDVAASKCRARGMQVVNPAELDLSEGKDPSTMDTSPEAWVGYMRRDIRALMDCDAIAVLPGWRESKGASLEVAIGKALGFKICDAETLREIAEETILEEAGRLVHGARGADYGHPLDDFDRTAKIWAGIFGRRVTAEQVALCMVGLKISRECNRPKRDNRVDMAGYAETLDMVHAEKDRRLQAQLAPYSDKSSRCGDPE